MLQVDQFVSQWTIGQINGDTFNFKIIMMPFKSEFFHQSRCQYFNFELSESSSNAHSTPKTKRQVCEGMSISCMWTACICVILQPTFRNKLFAFFEMAFIETQQ